MLASAIQQHESATNTRMFPLLKLPLPPTPSHPSGLSQSTRLSSVPIEQLPPGYPFYTWWCTYVNATVSSRPILSFPHCVQSLFSMSASLFKKTTFKFSIPKEFLCEIMMAELSECAIFLEYVDVIIETLSLSFIHLFIHPIHLYVSFHVSH